MTPPPLAQDAKGDGELPPPPTTTDVVCNNSNRALGLNGTTTGTMRGLPGRRSSCSGSRTHLDRGNDSLR